MLVVIPIVRQARRFCGWVLLLAVWNSCTPEVIDRSHQELEQALVMTGTWAGLLGQLNVTLDWSSESALEQSALDSIRSHVGLLGCVTSEQDGRVLRLTYTGCASKNTKLNGKAEIQATGQISGSSSELRLTVEIDFTFSLPNGLRHTLGSLEMIHRKETPTRSEQELSLTVNGTEHVFMVGSALRVFPCVTLDGLGHGEGLVDLVVAPTALTYCIASCPTSGSLGIAGHHLQLLQFANGLAERSLDSGAYEPLANPPCGSLEPMP